MSGSGKAVFLSYASQDAEAAKKIADALRSAAVEVWFDQSELVGGDAWDAKIRGQIKACALFVPVISANTQARLEGYFRREWRLAVDRMHDMDDAVPFLFPVVIDDTADVAARVPERFRERQWTRLPGGETPPSFCHRLQRVLEEGTGETRPIHPATEIQTKQARSHRTRKRWIAPVIGGVLAAALALAVGQPWRGKDAPSPAVQASPAGAALPPAASASDSAVAALRARIAPDRWQRGDFEAMAPQIDRLIEQNPENADAWALRSIVHSLQVVRLIDPGTKPLAAGRAAADRALRLASDLPLGQLALGLHFTANVSRGGDPRASRDAIDRAVAALLPDDLTRYVQLVSYWLGYDLAEVERHALAWHEAKPQADYPVWLLGSYYVALRQPEEAEKWLERATADTDITGVRALINLVDVSYYLRGDLARAQAALARVPVRFHGVARVTHWRWLLAMAQDRWDDALQSLAVVPDAMLYDVQFIGPKALLAGQAHERAGRAGAAAVQFGEAERVLREQLATDPDDEALRAALALTLACGGRPAEARAELALVEPLVRARAPNVYRGRLMHLIAQSHAELGDSRELAFWLRKFFAEPNGTPYTPASLLLDPRYNQRLGSPEVQALLTEFARLEPKAAARRATVDQKSVAVLAFENLSDDKANEYFSDGVSEELLNVLAKVPGLKVSARTSAFLFKGKDTPIPEIARQLGVAYVVEGSVRKQGDRVRITAQLIKATDGFHVWSDTFTRDLKDIFVVQDEIAGLIAQQLELKLGSLAAARQVDPEAHRLVLEGRHYWNLRTEEGFNRAEAAFRKALEFDPDFAPAHAGLALLEATRVGYAAYAGETRRPSERWWSAARRALELDPGLADGYAALAYGFFCDGRAADSEQEYKKALALNPNSALLHHWYALTLENAGRLDAALAEITTATTLDPMSGIALVTRERMATAARRYTETLDLHERVVGLLPEAEAAFGFQSMALLQLGRGEEAAAAALRVSPHSSLNRRVNADAWVVHVLLQTGHAAEAANHAAQVMPRFRADSYQRGCVLAAQGRWDEAVPFLERTPPTVRYLFYWDPTWDAWRNDPKFAQLLAKLGCTEEYRVARETLARMVQNGATKK